MSANGPSRYEVYVINADGTEEQRLTSTDVQSLGPTWSPDSISILYVSGPNGAPGLYRINRDGSGQTKLSVGMNKFVEPDWSPNGSKIAAAKQGFTDHNIYILNANGSGAVKLATTPGNPQYLDWSPDGSLITFSANGSLKPIDCGSDWRKPNQIFVVKVRNGEIKQLTNDCDESMGPSWSPDGSKIIFSAGSYMKTSIYIMDADGRNKVQMTDVPVF